MSLAATRSKLWKNSTTGNFEISLADLFALDPAALIEQFDQSWRAFVFGGNGRLAPLCWVTMLLICAALYLRRRPKEGFWRWVFPRKVYSGRSFWLDVKLLVLENILAAFGLIAAVGFAPLITV